MNLFAIYILAGILFLPIIIVVDKYIVKNPPAIVGDLILYLLLWPIFLFASIVILFGDGAEIIAKTLRNKTR